MNGPRYYRSSVVPAEEAGNLPEDANGKGPGAKLIRLLASRVYGDLSACGRGIIEEFLEPHLIITVEGIGSVPAFELDEHFHTLERGSIVLEIGYFHVVESDVRFVICALFNGWIVRCVNRSDAGAERVRNL